MKNWYWGISAPSQNVEAEEVMTRYCPLSGFAPVPVFRESFTKNVVVTTLRRQMAVSLDEKNAVKSAQDRSVKP
jgi:hypothetical protein